MCASEMGKLQCLLALRINNLSHLHKVYTDQILQGEHRRKVLGGVFKEKEFDFRV